MPRQLWHRADGVGQLRFLRFKARESRVLDKLVGSRVDALGSGVDGDIARGEEFRKAEKRRSIESR